MSDFLAFFILYVASFTIMQSTCYMVCIHQAWFWFPNHPGLISGITIGGFGLGALIFDPITSHLVNPSAVSKNENTGRFPDDVNDSFIPMMRTTIYIFAGIALFGIITVFQGPIKKVKE